MIEFDQRSKPPISDDRLRAIVKCIEAIDAHKEWEHDWKVLYRGLVGSLEKFLLNEWKREYPQNRGGPNHSVPWHVAALAELVDECWYCVPAGRTTSYLLRAAEDGYLPAQTAIIRKGRSVDLYPPQLDSSNEARGLSMDELEWFNRDEVAHWLPIAAEGGSAEAQCILGMELVESDDPHKFAKGVQWLTQAVFRKMNPSEAIDGTFAQAHFVLAYLIELGRTDPIRQSELFQLYETAANGGISEAMLAVGHYLEHGIGVKRNKETACDWYWKAGKAGLDGGYIANWQLAGPDVNSDFAANAGHIPAMIARAEEILHHSCCSVGRPIDEDWWIEFDDGIEWLDCASLAGNVEAAIRAAKVLEGVSEHQFPIEVREAFLGYPGLERALEFYQRAGELGWKFSAQNIERVQRKLNRMDQGMESGDE